MADDYGLTQEQREAIDELIPGWEDMRPGEILTRAAAIQEQHEAEAADFYGLRDLIFWLVEEADRREGAEGG